jgi:hypothetical protein
MEDNFQIKSTTVAFDDGVVADKPASPVVEAPVVEAPVVEAPAEESIVSKAIHAVEEAFTVGDAQEVAK